MKRILGAVAIAAVLALTGCSGHSRGNSGLSTTDQTHVTSGQPATSTPPTVGAGNRSTAARLTAIDAELNGVDSSLSSIDSNITAADKAGDDDN